MSGLIQALPAQDPSSLLSAAQREFGQQTRFPAARFGFEQHQAALPRLRPFELGIEHRQLLASTNERRLSECLTAIVQPDDECRFGLTVFQRFRDHRQVRNHGLRRLVAVARILAQQTLNDFIQHARHW